MSRSGTKIDLEFINQSHEIDAVVIIVTESTPDSYIPSLANVLIDHFGVTKKFILIRDNALPEHAFSLKYPFIALSLDLYTRDVFSDINVDWPRRPLLICVGEQAGNAAASVYALAKIALRHEGTNTPLSSLYDTVLDFNDALTFDFNTFCKTKQLRDISNTSPDPLNVLVLYDELSTHVQTIYEHLEAFQKHSANSIYYATCTKDSNPTVSINQFDVLILHFSVRISLTDYLNSDYGKKIRNFKGYKILFIQDEFDTTETSRKWMDFLGFHLVFSIVPSKYIPDVYSPKRYPGTQFVFTMPGFISEVLMSTKYLKPLNKRTIDIGYRGRSLPYWYGRFGQEKKWIGERAKLFFSKEKINIDIEWEDNKRIYGEAWYHFLSNCKTMLGCEGGCNIFDFDGTLKSNIEQALEKNPQLSFEEVESLFLKDKEGHILTNQITPKFFEAIALKVGLILYEGYYSGVLEPYKHYIPLKKDFSNTQEVIALLKNYDFLEAMIKQTYHDIVGSKKYTYMAFVTHLDKFLSKEISTQNTVQKIIETSKVSSSLLGNTQSLKSNKANPSKHIYIFWRPPKVNIGEILLRSVGKVPSAMKHVIYRVTRLLCS